MKAKIKNITFGEGKLFVQVDYFYKMGENGYDDCYREIMQVVDETAVGTGKWRLYPFNSMGMAISLNATKEDVMSTIFSKIKRFKEAHAKLAELKSWIGTEIEDK